MTVFLPLRFLQKLLRVITRVQKHFSLSCDQLIAEQRNDAGFSPLFEAALAGEKAESLSSGYFVRNGLLMRKWTPLNPSVA